MTWLVPARGVTDWGDPAAELRKVAGCPHGTKAPSEGCPQNLDDASTVLHFAPTNTLFILIRASKRKSQAALPTAGGALPEPALTFLRRSAKC